MNTQSFIKIITNISLVCSTLIAQAQFVSTNSVSVQSFTAMRNGKNIGWLKTISSQNGNERSLSIESKLTVVMLFTFEAKAFTINKFKGNILIQAGVYRTLNGKEKLDNELQLAEGRYRIVKGESAYPIDKAIYHTAASIYFLEPIGVTEIFSEVYMQFVPLKNISASVYVSQLPDGGSMTYEYKMGRLTNITASTSYGTVLFKLNQ